MNRLNAALSPAPVRPVKVLQFGEGNFLRAFVDYFIDIANEQTGFDGSVVLVKPIAFGNLDRFHEQDCRYTVVLRGLEEGKRVEKTRLITSVSDAVDAVFSAGFSDAFAWEVISSSDIGFSMRCGRAKPDAGSLH